MHDQLVAKLKDLAADLAGVTARGDGRAARARGRLAVARLQLELVELHLLDQGRAAATAVLHDSGSCRRAAAPGLACGCGRGIGRTAGHGAADERRARGYLALQLAEHLVVGQQLVYLVELLDVHGALSAR